MRLSILAACFAALALLTSCNELNEGVNARIEGDWQKAVDKLGPIANDARKQNPVSVKCSIDRNTTLAQAAPGATYDLFRGWEAYAASLLALGRKEEHCQAVRDALRPVEVRAGRKRQVFDPTQNGAVQWQGEVCALRAYLAQCQVDAGEANIVTSCPE